MFYGVSMVYLIYQSPGAKTAFFKFNEIVNPQRQFSEMLKIVFLHPDLGIGGAERLVVDAALALQLKGHQVHIVTSYHDPAHCFPETRDGTIPVTISGNWLPRSIFG